MRKNEYFNKKIVGYVRVSTEEQKAHGISIEAQTDAIEQWAKSNGVTVSKIYNDAGFSARKPYNKRPAMIQLLEDVKLGEIGLVVFTRLDRWFRSLQGYYQVQDVMEKHNVAWKAIQEDYETATASGRLKVNIMLSVAQDEADRTSERIKAVFEVKRQKKEPLTGDCPTGYKLEGKKFIKDPEKEEAVEAFFRTFLESGSVSAALNIAHEKGLRIYYQLAHKMLSHPAYYGYYFDVDGMTPPYITKEEFDKIQSMRRRVVRKTVKNRVYIFSGLVFCGECGGRMGGRVNTNQASQFYNCTSHYMRVSGCENTSNMLERKIEEYLINHVDDQMFRLKLEAEGLHGQEKKRDYRAEMSALNAKSERLKNLYINGLISFEDCQKGVEENKKKIESLEQEEKSSKKIDFSALEKVLCNNWKEIYNSMLEREEKRDFWRIIIKEIRIYKDRHIEFDLNL